MKTRKYTYATIVLLLGLVYATTTSCERDLSDDAILSPFPNTAEVFTDSPIGLGSDFYFPYGGSKATAWSIDDEVSFEGSSSMRFDVPNADDPEGNFAGAIFRIEGAGRDLSQYDALTFWAKASQGVNIGEIGFGEDFIENKFIATRTNVSIGTAWAKYVIPIPDASKLIQERGVLRYSAGTQETNGFGYTFWMDEVRFETLGTVAQPRPRILNGNDESTQSFNGATIPITGLSQTFNTASGDVTVIAAPAYFDFASSNTGVATVDETGLVTIVGSGTATITASIDGVDAQGSLTIESLGEFEGAPVPDEAPENVISIFSDAYTNVPVDYYNGFFAPFQTTLGGTGPGGADININGDGIINYTQLNFVGVGTFLNVSPVDATGMTHFHVDINIRENIDPGDFLRLELLNGVQTSNEISGSVTYNSSQLSSNQWISLDIPLGEFNGLSARDALGLIFFVSDATISEIYVDNIYYYKEVIDPSPNVDDSAATQVELPIGFESTTLTYDFLGFAGADSAIEANPMPTGINPTSTVMRSTKTNGAEFFAGTFVNLDAPIDFSTSQKLRIKVLSPKSGIPIRVRLENVDNSVGIELDSNTTTSNEWEELEWDFSGMDTSASFVRVVVFFEFVPGLPGDGSTYYYDDIQIIN